MVWLCVCTVRIGMPRPPGPNLNSRESWSAADRPPPVARRSSPPYTGTGAPPRAVSLIGRRWWLEYLFSRRQRGAEAPSSTGLYQRKAPERPSRQALVDLLSRSTSYRNFTCGSIFDPWHPHSVRLRRRCSVPTFQDRVRNMYVTFRLQVRNTLGFARPLGRLRL
jgi:hypothetical protein